LIYRTGGLLIAADGRSLDRAGIGDHLRVMNLASRQTVTGFVHEDGSVTVAPGASRLPDFPSN
jgi:flagella basal body P-ring formation protein FlgA